MYIVYLMQIIIQRSLPFVFIEVGQVNFGGRATDFHVSTCPWASTWKFYLSAPDQASLPIESNSKCMMQVNL